MTRSYRHLTFEERCQVKIPKKGGLSKGSTAQHPTGNGGWHYLYLTHKITLAKTEEERKSVDLLSKMTPFCHPIMTRPCGTEGQLERSRSRTSPQDEPSQSFLCRSSLVAFPSLPDEKEFLQPEGGQI